MRWPELIARASEELALGGVPSPAVDARELAEHVSGIRHVQLATQEVPAEQAEAFDSLVRQRRARVPLQHLTGKMYFRYLELMSRPEAFIVRPETELLAEEAIAEAKKIPGALVVDLCTGSGAIAISVVTEAPGTRVIAVEKSPLAAVVARENNAAYGSLVSIVEADATTIASQVGLIEPGVVDVVVTNPPYVPPTHAISAEAQADPQMALWGGGEEGLEIPAKIVAQAAVLLRPGGLLLMEHAEEQAQALRDCARGEGFSEASTGYDLSGRPRWLRARKAGSHSAFLGAEEPR